MAQIKESKNSTVKTWIVSWNDGEMNRSKAIKTEQDARRFKELVEEAGDQMPTVETLDANGFLDYGDWLHPSVLLHFKRMVDAAGEDPKAWEGIRQALGLMVTIPR